MTLSTSDKKLLRQLILHLGAAAGFAFFGAVYERFSHEVYSYRMIYAFAFPLLLGAFPYAVCLWKSYDAGTRAMQLWNAAVFTWTVGSVFRGVLEIYGTTNRLILVYPVAGAVSAAAAAIALLDERKLRKTHPEEDAGYA